MNNPNSENPLSTGEEQTFAELKQQLAFLQLQNEALTQQLRDAMKGLAHFAADAEKTKQVIQTQSAMLERLTTACSRAMIANRELTDQRNAIQGAESPKSLTQNADADRKAASVHSPEED